MASTNIIPSLYMLTIKLQNAQEHFSSINKEILKIIQGGVTNGARTPPEETADPELAKYLNRDYWQSKVVSIIFERKYCYAIDKDDCVEK